MWLIDSTREKILDLETTLAIETLFMQPNKPCRFMKI